MLMLCYVIFCIACICSACIAMNAKFALINATDVFYRLIIFNVLILMLFNSILHSIYLNDCVAVLLRMLFRSR